MSNSRAKPATTRPQKSTAVAKNPPAKQPATRAPVKAPSAPKTPLAAPRRPPQSRNPPSGTNANRLPTVTTKPAQPQQDKSGNWLNRTVQNSVAGVGNYAGSFINSIGDSVNKFGQGVGDSVNNTTRYWGQGVAGYGNNIKDAVGVGGPRVATGGNPLGLAGQGSSKTAQTQSGGKANNAIRSQGRGGGSNPLGLSE